MTQPRGLLAEGCTCVPIDSLMILSSLSLRLRFQMPLVVCRKPRRMREYCCCCGAGRVCCSSLCMECS